MRAINIRRGLRREDEKPPETHWKKRVPELEAELLDSYYKLKGWNKEGIPTLASLYDLGLGYVGEDLLAAGFIFKRRNKIQTRRFLLLWTKTLNYLFPFFFT